MCDRVARESVSLFLVFSLAVYFYCYFSYLLRRNTLEFIEIEA